MPQAGGKISSQLDKEAWLRLAADWIKLAANAEERGAKFGASQK